MTDQTRSGNQALSDLVAQRTAGDGDLILGAASGDDSVPLLLLRLGTRWFGLRAEAVREVVARDTVTRVPGLSPHIRGVALIHGRLVPVVALEQLLALPAADADTDELEHRRLVVLVEEVGEIAILANDAKGVIHLSLPTDDQSASASGAATGLRNQLIRCEVAWGQELVCILDGPAVITAAVGGEVR